jgi:hypothetical protein
MISFLFVKQYSKNSYILKAVCLFHFVVGITSDPIKAFRLAT